MSSFDSIVDALTGPVTGQGVGGKLVPVRLGGRVVEMRHVPGPVALAIKRAAPQPTVPMRHTGGSLSARVPVDRDSAAFAAYAAKLEVWFLEYRASVIVAASMNARGELASPFTDAHAASVVKAGAELAARLTADAVDRAFTELEAADEDVSPGALAIAEADLIVRPGPDAPPAENPADLIEAREKGGDGVTAPYALPPSYGLTSAYFAHYACELYGCTPDRFVAIDAATKVRMVAYARLRHAERERDVAATAAGAAAVAALK